MIRDSDVDGSDSGRDGVVTTVTLAVDGSGFSRHCFCLSATDFENLKECESKTIAMH